jgi:hypothetical protein
MVNDGYYGNLVGGWVSTPLKNDGVEVSWDDDYSQYMENH